VDCFNLSKVVRPTDTVFLNDGLMRAEVIDVEEDAVKIRFKEGGMLPSGT
jgi:pyruvate kinase